MAGFVADDDVILHPTKEDFHAQYFREGKEYDTYFSQLAHDYLVLFARVWANINPKKSFQKGALHISGFTMKPQ